MSFNVDNIIAEVTAGTTVSAPVEVVDGKAAQTKSKSGI